MEKKIKIKYFFLLCALLLTENTYSQEFNKMQNTNHSFVVSEDTIVKIDNKNVLVRFTSLGFGLPRTKIEISTGRITENPEWKNMCTLTLVYSPVIMELDDERREMLFKSHKGKILMVLSFDAFF